MAVSPLDKPPYTPLFPPPVQSIDLQQVENWVKQELDTIARYTTAQPGTLFTPGNAIPARPRTGILTYADGTNWNPGYGEGLYVYKGGVWVPVGVGAGNRIRLSTATTFYVATNGNDANDGLTPATAWLTLAHAISVLTGQYDFGGQTVTLQAVAGHATFTSRLNVTPWIGGGSFVFDLGGGSISYVGVDSVDAAINVQGGALPGAFTIQNGTISSSTGASTLFCSTLLVQSASSVSIGTGVTFGPAGFAQIMSNNGGAVIKLINSFTVASGANAGYLIFGNTGLIANFAIPLSITFAGPLTYSGATVNASAPTLVVVGLGLNWGNPNNVTGKRFNADTGGFINTQGRGTVSSFIPGTINGTITPPGAFA